MNKCIKYIFRKYIRNKQSDTSLQFITFVESYTFLTFFYYLDQIFQQKSNSSYTFYKK